MGSPNVQTQSYQPCDRNKKFIINAPQWIQDQHPLFFQRQSTEIYRKKNERHFPIGGSYNAFSGSAYGGDSSC